MTLFLAADHARRADPNWRPSTTASSSNKASTTTPPCAIWLPPWPPASRRAGAAESAMCCATSTGGRSQKPKAGPSSQSATASPTRSAKHGELPSKAKKLKGRTGRRSQKSTGAAPASGPSTSRKSTRPRKSPEPLTTVRNSTKRSRSASSPWSRGSALGSAIGTFCARSVPERSARRARRATLGAACVRSTTARRDQLARARSRQRYRAVGTVPAPSGRTGLSKRSAGTVRRPGLTSVSGALTAYRRARNAGNW